MNTQFSHIAEGLLAGRSQSAVQLSVAPVAVLHTDVLVLAGNIENFLWVERTWCLFMSSKMNSVRSRCVTIHVTFTTYKTFACTFRTCLCWLLWMPDGHVLFQCIPVLVCTVALVAHKVVFLTMREQFPDCLEQNIRAKYTIIRYSWVENLNMLHL